MDASKTTIILGPPGTGKTETLLTIVEKALANGVEPSKIGFISFTKKAVEEGKSRASEKFGIHPDDLVHFRTIHSFAFRHLGQKRDQMFGYYHLRELGHMLGLEFNNRGEMSEDATYGMCDSDRIVFIEGLARNTRRPLRDVWSDAMEDAVNWFELERFSKALAAFKKSRMLRDFNDLIEIFSSSDPKTMPQLDLLLVDESQDLSALAWTAVEVLAINAKQIFICGDDDQCIYKWAGADVQRFISIAGTTRVLDVSYRIPKSVHALAESISSRISNRRPKTWRPREEVGQVNWFNSIEEIPMDEGSWLLMARHGYQLTAMENHCLSQGYSFNSVGRDPLKSPTLKVIQIWENLRKGAEESAERILDVFKYMATTHAPAALVKRLKADESSRMYAMPELVQLGLGTTDLWHRSLTKISTQERDYFIAVRKRGEKLLQSGRCVVSTVHSAKGAEADNVVLTTDLSLRTYNNMESNFDDECRVFYVGTTRAKKTLNLIIPQTDLHFEL
jgi:DNA helicase-2/ATP-dependent DNA helicase PcrA